MIFKLVKKSCFKLLNFKKITPKKNKKLKKSWKERDYRLLERVLKTKKGRESFLKSLIWYFFNKRENIEKEIAIKKYFKK